MKKSKLSSEPNYKIHLLGISSPAREYKLAWWINDGLAIRLQKTADIVMELKESGKIAISNFTFETEHCIFRLLKNRILSAESEKGGYLLKELHQFDYLLTIDDKSETFDLPAIGDKLKLIPDIIHVQPIIVDKLKDKENLIM